jgi:HSP20 family protein
VPAVDIVEEKSRFVLRADVPGVNPKDVDVSMDNGILSVSGQRLAIDPGEDAGVQRLERATGRFLRRFTLPETADAEAIAAKYANGILEVTIPKSPEIQARRITVEAA